MPDGLVATTAQVDMPDDRRIYGITIAQVIDNQDQTNLGRVQVRLPWLPGYEPWARVAVLEAGANRGTYFIPQVGDEVLVSGNHGDISDLYVIGSLWNGQDHPPAQAISDPVNKRMICTPQGHKIEFDDADQSITIIHASGGQVELKSDHIELAIGSASIRLEKSGGITIKTDATLTLDARTINLSADSNLTLSGQQSAKIDGGSYCSINASSISIED